MLCVEEIEQFYSRHPVCGRTRLERKGRKPSKIGEGEEKRREKGELYAMAVGCRQRSWLRLIHTAATTHISSRHELPLVYILILSFPFRLLVSCSTQSSAVLRTTPHGEPSSFMTAVTPIELTTSSLEIPFITRDRQLLLYASNVPGPM